MPKLSTPKARLAYEEKCDIRRNLKIMTEEDIDQYCSTGKSLSEILGSRFKHKRI